MTIEFLFFVNLILWASGLLVVQRIARMELTSCRAAYAADKAKVKDLDELTRALGHLVRHNHEEINALQRTNIAKPASKTAKKSAQKAPSKKPVKQAAKKSVKRASCKPVKKANLTLVS